MKLYHHTSFRLLLFIWLHFRHGRNISCVLLCVLSAINMMMIFFVVGSHPKSERTGTARVKIQTHCVRISYSYIYAASMLCALHLSWTCIWAPRARRPLSAQNELGVAFLWGPIQPHHTCCGDVARRGPQGAASRTYRTWTVAVVKVSNHISHTDFHCVTLVFMCLSEDSSGDCEYVCVCLHSRRCVVLVVILRCVADAAKCELGCARLKCYDWLGSVESGLCVWVTNVHQSQLVIYSETLFGTMPFKFRVHIIYADMGLFCWKLSAWNVCEWYKSIRMIYV